MAVSPAPRSCCSQRGALQSTSCHSIHCTLLRICASHKPYLTWFPPARTGYIPVSDTKQLFYYMIESKQLRRKHQMLGRVEWLSTAMQQGQVLSSVEHQRQLLPLPAAGEGNPAEDPVVLWLNGGPGCSSFDGFVYEMGPFLFSSAPSAGKGTTQVQLSDNPYAWSVLCPVCTSRSHASGSHTVA